MLDLNFVRETVVVLYVGRVVVLHHLFVIVSVRTAVGANMDNNMTSVLSG